MNQGPSGVGPSLGICLRRSLNSIPTSCALGRENFLSFSQHLMTWRQELYIWAHAIFYTLSGLIARGIRIVNNVFNARRLRPTIDLPTYSRSSSFIQQCDHSDGIRMCFVFGDFTLPHCFDFLAMPWAMFDPVLAKCGSRMSRHSTHHGTRRPIIPSAVTKTSLLSREEYFPMRGVNALHGAGSSRTSPSGHNTLTSPSVITPLFLYANNPVCLPGVVSASDLKLTGGVSHDHGLSFYGKRRKVPRFSSVADLTSSAIVNLGDSPTSVVASDPPDEEDRIAMVCNSVLKPFGSGRGSSEGFGLSLLAAVNAASRRTRKAHHTDLFSAAFVDPCMLGGHYLPPDLPVSPDVCHACSSEIRLLGPEAGGPRHSASVEEFETSEIVSADWDEESVSDCSLEDDYDVFSVSELKTDIVNIQAPRTSWVEFLDSESISPNLGTHHAKPPYPRKAVTTVNSRRHIRIHGNLLERQDESTHTVHLKQDYAFQALPDIESGLLRDCTRHSGLRALVLPNLVAQRISAGSSNLPLDSPEPLDCSSIVSAFSEMDGFERFGDVVPILKSGGLESLRALIAAMSPEIESSDTGLSSSMSSPTSDLSPWDEDSGSEANVSWGIAT